MVYCRTETNLWPRGQRSGNALLIREVRLHCPRCSNAVFPTVAHGTPAAGQVVLAAMTPAMRIVWPAPIWMDVRDWYGVVVHAHCSGYADYHYSTGTAPSLRWHCHRTAATRLSLAEEPWLVCEFQDSVVTRNKIEPQYYFRVLGYQLATSP